MKPVFKYSLEGVFLDSFNNGIEAARSIPKTNNKNIRSIAINIRKVCYLTMYTAYGHQWRFELHDALPPLTLEELKEKKTRGIRNANNRVNNGRSIHQWTLDGELVHIYDNIATLKLDWGKKIHAIQQCLSGFQMKSHNFHWSYSNIFDSSLYKENKRKVFYRDGQKHIIQNSK